MIRPAARAQLWRWREVGAAAAVGIIGAYWATQTFGLLQYLGYAVCLAGVLLAIVGWQRGRFRSTTQGQGVVTVIEGQVTYFGPYSGGVIAIDDIACIHLHQERDQKTWIIEQPAQPPVIIPVDARGSDQLFDAFATLPGLKIERMLSQLSQSRDGSVLIWRRETYVGAGKYLH